MLVVNYFDGFTEELICYEAVFTGAGCNIVYRSYIGGGSGKPFSMELDESKLDLLAVLEALLPLDERYTLTLDGTGSIECVFEWDGLSISRYFDGGIENHITCDANKAPLLELENCLYEIRAKILTMVS